MKRVVMIVDVAVALMFMGLAIDGLCMGNEIQMFGNLILATLHVLKLDMDARDD